MAKKELYYFCVSVDNGVKPRTDRPHYYGYTIATSESDAQSKACSYINEVTDWGKDGYFNCTVEAVRYADTFSGKATTVPDTVAVCVEDHGKRNHFETIVYHNGGNK